MVTPSERISRLEGVLEQMNERLGNIEARLGSIEGKLEQKADKSEVRLLFVTTITLMVAIIGILGAVLARV